MADASTTISPGSIRGELRLSRERMARLLDVSSKSIERWESAGISRGNDRARARLAQLAELIRLGRAVYTAEGFDVFLRTPIPEFSGRTALQMIEQGRMDAVFSALAADYEGAGA